MICRVCIVAAMLAPSIQASRIYAGPVDSTKKLPSSAMDWREATPPFWIYAGPVDSTEKLPSSAIEREQQQSIEGQELTQSKIGSAGKSASFSSYFNIYTICLTGAVIGFTLSGVAIFLYQKFSGAEPDPGDSFLYPPSKGGSSSKWFQPKPPAKPTGPLEPCPICFVPAVLKPWHPAGSTDCTHTFCEACITKARSIDARCPICRAEPAGGGGTTDPKAENDLESRLEDLRGATGIWSKQIQEHRVRKRMGEFLHERAKSLGDDVHIASVTVQTINGGRGPDTLEKFELALAKDTEATPEVLSAAINEVLQSCQDICESIAKASTLAAANMELFAALASIMPRDFDAGSIEPRDAVLWQDVTKVRVTKCNV